MSDLDNEEIEATRLLKNLEKKELDEMIKSTEGSIEETCKFLKDNSFIEYKEKSADEMFEDENYIKEFYDKMGDSTTSENCEVLVYRYYVTEEEIETQIEFYLEDEEVGINGLLNKRVLKAINKKCKELGWL